MAKARRPYERFAAHLFQGADATVDASAVQKAAKLLGLVDSKADLLHRQAEVRAREYHGVPVATKSAEELKDELTRLHAGLSGALDAWTGLSFDAKRLIREQYAERRLPALPHEETVEPTNLFGCDEMALLRAVSRTKWALDTIVPTPPGPPPEPRRKLGEWALRLAQKLTNRQIVFGTAKRAAVLRGNRTADYRACALLMRAVDPALTVSECEGPLEAALRSYRVAQKGEKKRRPPKNERSDR